LRRLSGHVEDRIVGADVEGEELDAAVAVLLLQPAQRRQVALDHRAARGGEDEDERLAVVEVVQRAGQVMGVLEGKVADLVSDLDLAVRRLARGQEAGGPQKQSQDQQRSFPGRHLLIPPSDGWMGRDLKVQAKIIPSILPSCSILPAPPSRLNTDRRAAPFASAGSCANLTKNSAAQESDRCAGLLTAILDPWQ